MSSPRRTITSTFSFPVEGVISGRSYEEMRGVKTWRVIAVMAYKLIARNWPDEMFIGYTVNAFLRFTANRYNSVAVLVYTTCIEPAITND